MRVWPLIAALSLAATGCAGLDLSGFDDEHLARLAENSAGRAPSPSPIEQAAPNPTPHPAESNAPVETSPRLFSPLPPPEPVAPLPPPEPPRPIEPATSEPSPLIEVPRTAAIPRPIPPPRPANPVEPVEPTPSPEPADTDQAATPIEPLNSSPAEEPQIAPQPVGSDPGPNPEPAPQRPATILASQATPIAPAEPRELALFDQVAGEVEAIALAEASAPLATPEPTPTAPPQGTVIATVGPQVITLPELTEAIKDRIARLPGRKRPTRRLVISMVQAEMEARILESLVLQQARVLLDAPGELDNLRAAIARQWSTAELPRILDREGFPSAEAFDARLRTEGQCLNDLRSAYTTRTLARELMRREGRADPNIDAYLNDLRTRFPIHSDLAQARRALARN